jgi:hypothetical protein
MGITFTPSDTWYVEMGIREAWNESGMAVRMDEIIV